MTKIALAHDHLFQIGGAENVLVVLSSMHKEAPIFTLINNSKISRSILDQSIIKTSKLQNIPGISKLFRYFLLSMPKTWEKTDLSDFEGSHYSQN